MVIILFFQIIIALLLGVGAGIFTGLIPGIHVNLVTVIVVSLAISSASFVANINPFFIAVFIISLALTHSFLDSIPSVYLGAPDSSQVIAVLPGHQFFLEGKGHLAVMYTLIGSLFALILTLLFIPFGLRFLQEVQVFLRPWIAWILIVVVIFLLWFSKKFLLNAFFFLLAGVFGLTCFHLVHQDQILLPMLSGLFGVSTLAMSLFGDESSRMKQTFPKNVPLESRDVEGLVSRATIVGILASFLPGFGSSQAALVASSTMKKKRASDYLILVGGINTVNFAFSLVTLFVLSKARNGAVLGLKSLIGELSVSTFVYFIPILLIVGGVASLLGVFLSKRFARFLDLFPYSKIVYGVLGLLVVMVFMFSHLQGLLILVVSSSLGIVASRFGAQKNMLLGVLLLPVIIYLL